MTAPVYVVATDLSAAARAALRQALRLADRDNATLHAVCVTDRDDAARVAKVTGAGKDETERKLTEHARRQLDRELDAAGAATVRHRHTPVGSPAKEIAALCKEVNASLLILGYHGHGEPGGGPGGIARACTRQAPCSVLLQRAAHEGPFKHVIAAADFSDESDNALAAAADFAKADNAELTLVHACANPYESPFLAESGMTAMVRFEEYAAALLLDLKARADKLPAAPGKPITAELIADPDASKAIASFARTRNADLTVLGAIGRSALRHLLMGSTSERVLARSPSSVLVVRAGD